MYDQVYKQVLSHPWIVPGAITIGWNLVQIKNILLDPLWDIPGPLCARFSRIWYLRAVSKGSF